MGNRQAYISPWFRWSLFNLWIVSFLGVLMRFKIIFPLPWFDQRNILHAHSHFAFAGWVTQALFCLMIDQLGRHRSLDQSKYSRLLLANQLTAFGMLLSFPFTGYGLLSIIFSTLSIFVTYWFAWVFWKDIRSVPSMHKAGNWFRAALFFLVISSLGPYYLAYMMATHQVQSNAYLASVYYYLHFQYNGWFFFACMGLLVQRLSQWGVWQDRRHVIFLSFALSCLPAYFLSALWLPIPLLIYGLVVIAVGLQLTGWAGLLKLLARTKEAILSHTGKTERALFVFSAIACSIKLLLQAGSVIPSLSKLAFGFRPIVIGYLHLVLLGVISLFILAMATHAGLLQQNNRVNAGLRLFVVAVIFNECLLMLQGVSDMLYQPISWINGGLLLAGLLLFISIGLMNVFKKTPHYEQEHKNS